MTTPSQDAPTNEGGTPAKSKVHPCNCLFGWRGEGLGSGLDVPADQAQVCDRTTAKAFAQGHDARFASRLANEVAEGLTDEADLTQLIKAAGGSQALIAKTTRSAKLRIEAKARKNAPKAPKQPKAASPTKAPKQAAQPSQEAPASSPKVAKSTRATVRAAGAPAVTATLERIDQNTGDEPVTDPQPGDVREVQHGSKTIRAVVVEYGDQLKLVHDLKGDQVCIHQLNGTFVATARKPS